ncbi:unnamed protein product, partial [marine sediment metagenome]
MPEKSSKKEYEEKVLELANKGLTSEKIGEELRQQGIHPKEYGKKISKILGDKYINPDIKNIETKLDERIKGVEKKEHLIKLLHDELLKILGKYKQLKLKKGKNIIIFLGLYGAGKTTTIAKIGNYFAKRGNKVALVGLDVHRPAAQEQLKQLGEKNKLPYFIDLKEKDPIKIWKKYKKELK